MSYFKTALKMIVNALSFILLGLLILVVYGKATAVFGGNSYPNYFGYTIFSVASGSMEPTLYINDVILVKLDNKDINKDDIITYVDKDDIITHRVIDIDGESFIVKGDNNNTIDSPIKKEQIIGKTVKIFPKLSIWQKVLTEPKILIVLFITLLLFDFAISYKGKDNKKEKIIKKPEEPKEEIKITKVNPDAKTKKKENQKLLELTRKIEVDEITELIKEEKIDKPKTKKDESQEDIDYTVRLDLNEIQKKIRDKVK